MTTSFQCPNCSASIPYKGHGSSVPCPYCGTTAIVPEELRSQADAGPETLQSLDFSQIMAELRAGRKINAIKLYRELTGVGLKEAKDAVEQMGAAGWNVSQRTEIDFQITSDAGRQAAPTSASRSNWPLAFTIIAVFMVAIGAVVWFLSITPTQSITFPTATFIPSPTPFATTALTFGSEGTGAGYFKDARSVAVDTQGRIYVGDYLPGGIQAFSAEGNFLWQYITPGDTDYVYTLAAG